MSRGPSKGRSRNLVRLLVMQGRRIGDADDQLIIAEEPGHRRSPGLCAGRMQEVIARALKLAACRCHGISVLDVEFD